MRNYSAYHLLLRKRSDRVLEKVKFSVAGCCDFDALEQVLVFQGVSAAALADLRLPFVVPAIVPATLHEQNFVFARSSARLFQRH